MGPGAQDLTSRSIIPRLFYVARTQLFDPYQGLLLCGARMVWPEGGTTSSKSSNKFHRGTNVRWTLIGFQILITVQGNVGQRGR